MDSLLLNHSIIITFNGEIWLKLGLYNELSFRTFWTQNLDPGHYLSFRSSVSTIATFFWVSFQTGSVLVTVSKFQIIITDRVRVQKRTHSFTFAKPCIEKFASFDNFLCFSFLVSFHQLYLHLKGLWWFHWDLWGENRCIGNIAWDLHVH